MNFPGNHRSSLKRRCHGKRIRAVAYISVVALIDCTFHVGIVDSLDTIIKDNDYVKDTMTSTTAMSLEDNATINTNDESSDIPSKTSQSRQQSKSDSTDANHHPETRWGSSSAFTFSTASSATFTNTELAGEQRDDTNVKKNVVETDQLLPDESKQHGRWGRATQQSPLTTKGSASGIEGHINPPEGFAVTARVFIDDKDKLTHFDAIEVNDDTGSTKSGHNGIRSNRIMFPFYDCGVFGSTTAALPVKQIYFRHTLSSPTSVYIDQTSSDNSLVLHPVLAVALSSLTVELNSGERMEFVAGDVILFEDTIRPGHVLTVSHESASLTVLLVTLPNKHHHIGKQYLSIKAALSVHSQKSTPCRTTTSSGDNSGDMQSDPKSVDHHSERHSVTNSNLTTSSAEFSLRDNVHTTSPAIFSDGDRQLRFFLFGTVAFSLSTLMADFLGRTAPLWLAVGVGGTCFVIGATYGITMASDYVYTAFMLWYERRKFETNRGKSIADDNKTNL
jgi:hypothetical protein